MLRNDIEGYIDNLRFDIEEIEKSWPIANPDESTYESGRYDTLVEMKDNLNLILKNVDIYYREN